MNRQIVNAIHIAIVSLSQRPENLIDSLQIDILVLVRVLRLEEVNFRNVEGIVARRCIKILIKLSLRTSSEPIDPPLLR